MLNISTCSSANTEGLGGGQKEEEEHVLGDLRKKSDENAGVIYLY